MHDNTNTIKTYMYVAWQREHIWNVSFITLNGRNRIYIPGL